MEEYLRAGVAVFNVGEFHAAHDAWEDRWLGLERGSDDERLLHGLIQFTAAVYHAYGGNWEGVQGLAESAVGYLDGLPSEYRSVNVEVVRSYLRAVAADPEYVERVAVPSLTYDGQAVLPEDLLFGPLAIVAHVFAEEYDGYDEETVDRAIEFAHEDLADGDETSQLVVLVMDFARDAANRDIVYQRLADHVARREHVRGDVEDLF